MKSWIVERRERIWREQGGRCFYCGAMTTLDTTRSGSPPTMATLDHKVPRSRGGNDLRANVVVACYACNYEKGDMRHEAFQRIIAARASLGLTPDVPHAG